MGIFNFFKKGELPVASSDVSATNIKYLELVLNKWLRDEHKKGREEQLLAEKYYDGEQDILNREKQVIGKDGLLMTINNVPNNRLVDNQYRKLVDQKTNYVLGKPLTIATAKTEYLKSLNKVFNKKIHRKLRTLAQNAVNGGIAYLYPFYGPDGDFKVAVFPAHEICPLWNDKEHTELGSAMRFYSEEIFDNKGQTSQVYHVDLFTVDGITHFIYKNGSLALAKIPHSDYIYVDDKGYNWNRLPIIPFKYNSKEIPLIRDVKSLQDALNEVISEFKNRMDEDPRNAILVLENYDGTNLAEFRQMLALFGVVKVRSENGAHGGVKVLTVDVKAENYQALEMQLKRALVENGRGFDAKEERMDGDPNQMNIESMYTDIDLDVNAMETEFQAGFEELKWFIDQYLITKGEPDYSADDVEFVFNRDIFINEDAKIENCSKSVGLISTKTILARHPWVTNVEHEMQLLEEDRQAEQDELEAMSAFNKTANDQHNETEVK